MNFVNSLTVLGLMLLNSSSFVISLIIFLVFYHFKFMTFLYNDYTKVQSYDFIHITVFKFMIDKYYKYFFFTHFLTYFVTNFMFFSSNNLSVPLFPDAYIHQIAKICQEYILISFINHNQVKNYKYMLFSRPLI